MIDKKGKLFGIINIIDLIVLIAVVGIIVVGTKRMKGPQVSVTQTTEGTVIYEISNVRQVTVDSIHIGENVYHYDKGVLIGEIVNKEVLPYKEEAEFEGKWYMSEVPERYVVNIEVKTNIEENEQYYTVGGEQTRAGGQYRLKNKSFTGFGTCLGVSTNN